MHFYYLHVTYDEVANERVLQLLANDNGNFKEIPDKPIVLKPTGHIILKGVMKREQLQFYYGYDEDNLIKAGEEQDAGILSDDYVRKGGLHDRPAFTGAFAGICCQDVSGEKLHADFGWFEMSGKESIKPGY